MKHARILLFYAVAAVAVLYARCAQMLYLTEEGSGFFTSDGMPVAIAVTIFIILATSAAAFVSLLSRRTPKGAPAANPALSFASVLLAAALVFEAVWVDYVTNAIIFVRLTRLFAALSAIVMLCYAFCPAIKKGAHYFKLALICPVIFFLFKLVSVFTVYATVSVIAANVFFLVYLCGALIFFLLFAKIENGITPKLSAYWMFPAAVVATIAALCCVVPPCVVLLTGKPELIHQSYDSFACCAAFALFALVYTVSLYRKSNIVKHKRRTFSLDVDDTYNKLGNQFVTDDNELPEDNTNAAQ